jgi:hypothetical protein
MGGEVWWHNIFSFTIYYVSDVGEGDGNEK